MKTALGLALASIIFLIPIAQANSPSSIIHSSSQTSPSIPSDFTLSTSPSFLELAEGTTGSSSITLTSQGGFSGNIVLSASSFFNFSLDKTSIQLASGQTATATLTILAATGTPPGSYTTLLTASSGCTLSHQTRITTDVTGPDFTLSAENTLLTAPPGGSDSSKIDLTSTNGFSGSVALSSFSFDLVPTLTPLSVSLSRSGGGSSTLIVTVPSATKPGIYTLDVTAASNSLFHIVEIQFTVTGPSFSLSASPISLTVQAGGPSNSSMITITPSGGFTGVVSLTNSSNPSGLATSISPQAVTAYGTVTSTLSVTGLSGATPRSNYAVIVTASSASLTVTVVVFVTVIGPDFELSSNPSSITIAAGGSSCASTITITSIEGFQGVVTLTNTTFPSGPTSSLSVTSQTAPFTSTLTISAPAGTPPSSYFVEVDGSSGPLTHYDSVTVQVTGPDFSLAAIPTALTMNAGSSATSTITLSPLNGFTSQVSLSALSTNTAVTTSVSPPNLTGSGTATLTLSSSPSTLPGVYAIQVTGDTSEASHNVFISLTIIAPDFSLSANPNTLTIGTGIQGTSTITIAHLSGFTGQVSLSTPPSNSLNATIQPPITGSGSATLSLNSTIAGSYTVELDGLSGPLFHSIILTVTVRPPDFSLPTSPGSLTIQAGSTSTTTITVTPAYGFTGTVTLTATVSPPGPSAHLSATTVPGGSGVSTLTVTVDASVPAATYTVTITATSGTLSHSAEVPITVAPAPPSPGISGILGLGSTASYALIAGVIIGLGLVGFLVLRMRKKTV